MDILTKPLDQVTEEDLRRLDRVDEQRQLDYKRDLPDASPRQRREFLKDVASFANSGGGAILYGIEESGGTATSMIGIAADADEARTRLDSMLLAGIEPRPRVEIRSIPLASGRFVMLVRLPRSFTAPHVVTFEGAQGFYARTSTGRRYPLNVEQIRAAFIGAEGHARRIRDYRLTRLAAIAAAETPVRLEPPLPAFVIHIVPLSAGDPFPESVDIAPVLDWRVPLLVESGGRRQNFDGVAAWAGVNQVRQYTQLTHNGSLEVAVGAESRAFALNASGVLEVRLSYLEGELWRVARQFIGMREQIGGGGPFYVMVSMLGVRGAVAAYEGISFEESPCDKSDLLVPEVLIDADVSLQELNDSLHYVVRRVRNAFNHDDSPFWVRGIVTEGSQ